MLTIRGLIEYQLVTTNYEESAEVIVGILGSTEGPNDMFNLIM